MTTLKYNLDFSGYWRYTKRDFMPCESGIYCVYAAIPNRSNNTVSLNKLIYIGESENINDRLQNHEKLKDWQKELKLGEEIYFSYATFDSIHRERLEAALIYKHKPPVNVEYKNNFPYDETTITTSGRNAKLSSYFTVYKTLTYAM